jgi:succinate dehydrogenase/fumarate reductase-like Fe-S protein
VSGFPEITVTIRLWRQPAGAAEGGWEEHRVTLPQGDHVLNLLAAVRRQSDPSLCYPDHFCKIGTCGACALVVDGKPALGCRALVTAPTIEVGPPRGRPILADLLAEEPPR